MIRRKTSNYTQNQEALHQASFTAMKGVDCSKAPTSEDTVLLAKNLDVDYDGGLVLRKPLKYKQSYIASDERFLTYAYDKKTVVKLFKEDYNMPWFTYPTNIFKCTDIYGITHTVDVLGMQEFFDFTNAKTVNTATSTLIYNVVVELGGLSTHLGLALLPYVEPSKQLRILKLYDLNNVPTLEMLTPEPTVITNADVPLDFNTVNYNTFSVRDNYEAHVVDIKGILAYTPKLSLSSTTVESMLIDDLTESDKFTITDLANFEDESVVVLKAFLDIPKTLNTDKLALKWSKSDDGINWGSNIHPSNDTVKVAYVSDKPVEDLNAEKSLEWKSESYTKFNIPSYEHIADHRVVDDVIIYEYTLKQRPDCLILSSTEESILDFSSTYKCTLVSLKDLPEEPSNSVLQEAEYQLDYVIGEIVYYFKHNTFNPSEAVFENPNKGNTVYWNHAIYSYGNGLGSNIYVSNPDSAVFPISRIIDLGTYQSSPVYKLVPWRNYLLAFTENSVHLIQEQDVGFTTKVINTSIGVSEQDANTCVSILNGVLFKSGSKIYTLIPNYSSGDETILNIAEVSKPIEHILESITYHSVYKPFAFTTFESYYLFIPNGSNDTTHCLKYDYSRKLWTYYEYPVLIFKYEILNVSDVRLFAIIKDSIADIVVEYYFEKEPEDVSDTQYYGDYLTTKKIDPDLEDGVDNKEYQVTPIEFYLDSGQKTDNISLTKQFVESKIIVATLSNKDNFSMDVRIDIEGNTFKRHIDLNTDGALLRSSADDVLTLGSNTDFTENQDTFNVMRQMFLRYAGKGKTIRHIISGQSLYKFKIYETFYRYKILNVKQ